MSASMNDWARTVIAMGALLALTSACTAATSDGGAGMSDDGKANGIGDRGRTWRVEPDGSGPRALQPGDDTPVEIAVTEVSDDEVVMRCSEVRIEAAPGQRFSIDIENPDEERARIGFELSYRRDSDDRFEPLLAGQGRSYGVFVEATVSPSSQRVEGRATKVEARVRQVLLSRIEEAPRVLDGAMLPLPNGERIEYRVQPVFVWERGDLQGVEGKTFEARVKTTLEDSGPQEFAYADYELGEGARREDGTDFHELVRAYDDEGDLVLELGTIATGLYSDSEWDYHVRHGNVLEHDLQDTQNSFFINDDGQTVRANSDEPISRDVPAVLLSLHQHLMAQNLKQILERGTIRCERMEHACQLGIDASKLKNWYGDDLDQNCRRPESWQRVCRD